MDRAGHHAVHFTLLEHHRADHDRIAEVLACDLLGPATVLPKLSQRGDVALGDALGVDHRDAVGQPQPEAAGQPSDLVWRSQQHAAGDAPLRARDRGLHDARLGALGQDDTRVGGASQLDQPVPEGGRAQPAGTGGAGKRLKPGRVQRIGDAVRHALDPFQVVCRQSGIEVSYPRRRLVAVVVDDEYGQASRERSPGKFPDLRVRHDPGGKEQGREMRPVQFGQAGGHDDVVAVARDQHEPALGEHAEAARDALREHRHVLDAPGLVALAEHLRVQLLDQVTYSQPGQLGAKRYRSAESQPALFQGLAQLCRRITDPQARR